MVETFAAGIISRPPAFACRGNKLEFRFRSLDDERFAELTMTNACIRKSADTWAQCKLVAI